MPEPDSVELVSTLTCPTCGFKQDASMPVDACQFFFERTHCHTLLKPLPGDCCVFCSYGSVPCPPVQEQNACCNRGSGK